MQATTRVKTTALGIVGAGLLLVGVYSAGAFSHPQNNTVNATTSATTTASATTDDSALVVNAAEYYQVTKNGVAADTNQVYDLQISGSNARGKYFNGDSGSVFYAHKTSNRWAVVFSGQVTIPKATAAQYSMPSSWADQTF